MIDIASPDYIRQRLEPRPGDPFYLHLSDLLLAMTDFVPQGVRRVLDFGCGGSPYRPLFGALTSHRADLAGSAAGLDFEYGSDSLLSAPSEDYDCVLSSQVLEHVGSPLAYLAECHRVLRPGGKLILSTHGLFEDHACPYDFWRWTVFGLQRLMKEADFTTEKVKKLTTGPRAAIFLAERGLGRQRQQFNFSRLGILSRVANHGLHVVHMAGIRRRHAACDVKFPRHRMVDLSEAGHDMYIAIALLAYR
jgi:SAM-dependent methyltransferase